MRLRSLGAAALLAAATIACTGAPASAADAPYDVLVFSKTAGFRHDAIPTGIQAIRDLGAANNFTVTATEDANAFTTANLAQYEAVVFLSTTGDVLNASQQTAFESYVRGGGGYAGVHAAADTEYDWSFYGELVGAYFSSHPAIQPVTVRVQDRAHAATAHLPQAWSVTDELYNYRTNPRSTAKVLATLDESTYSGGTMGADHPITWCKTVSSGRSFYTGLGHQQAMYADSNFRRELLGGIRYAAGRTRADCRPETGYTTLYNGSTTGWSQAGPGAFTNSDATLLSTGGLGLYWYQAKQFTNYSLKLDWNLAGDDNSGVFIGFPASSDPNTAINQGYEIQIDPTDTADRTTGSVYGFKSADLAARDAALNPPGEWNTYEIVVTGENLQVFLNGRKINDYTNTDPVRSLAGYVGIQNHGTGDDVRFRNIRIKESGTTTPSDTIQGEAYTSGSGISPYPHTPAHGGQVLGNASAGDWAAFAGIDLTGVTALRSRVASVNPTGGYQVRTGSTTGPVLGTVTVPNTGGWETYQDVTTTLTNVPSGTQTLYFTFTGGNFDIDDFTLVRGSTTPTGTGPVVGLAGKCLDVDNAGTADGTQVQIWTCNGSAAQTWTKNGQTLRALGKCLDVNGAGSADGTKIQLWTCNGTGAQNWVAQSDQTVRNPQSGKCLDVSANVSTDGQDVHLWTCIAGAANQRWTLPA
jgi:type 1 glutamine amidotransferase